MVMSPQPWGEALDTIRASEPDQSPRLVVPTPSGTSFTQASAQSLSGDAWLIFACGRYEGIDSRVMRHYASRDDWAGVSELSIGDYVLAGGEVAAMVMVEAVARLIPGVLGNHESAVDDSFAPGAMESLLEGPVFTKPLEWRGETVPDVLLSGHHANVAAWRREQAIERTRANRPDLLG
jgi:tRNA (guanine37-N1)-methyltransferase